MPQLIGFTQCQGCCSTAIAPLTDRRPYVHITIFQTLRTISLTAGEYHGHEVFSPKCVSGYWHILRWSATHLPIWLLEDAHFVYIPLTIDEHDALLRRLVSQFVICDYLESNDFALWIVILLPVFILTIVTGFLCARFKVYSTAAFLSWPDATQDSYSTHQPFYVCQGWDLLTINLLLAVLFSRHGLQAILIRMITLRLQLRGLLPSSSHSWCLKGDEIVAPLLLRSSTCSKSWQTLCFRFTIFVKQSSLYYHFTLPKRFDYLSGLFLQPIHRQLMYPVFAKYVKGFAVLFKLLSIHFSETCFARQMWWIKKEILLWRCLGDDAWTWLRFGSNTVQYFVTWCDAIYLWAGVAGRSIAKNGLIRMLEPMAEWWSLARMEAEGGGISSLIYLTSLAWRIPSLLNHHVGDLNNWKGLYDCIAMIVSTEVEGSKGSFQIEWSCRKLFLSSEVKQSRCS